MMVRKASKCMRVGMTGVKLSGHVGTWSVKERLQRVRDGEEVSLFVCVSESFSAACSVLYAADTGRSYVIISNSDAATVASEKGYK